MRGIRSLLIGIVALVAFSANASAATVRITSGGSYTLSGEMTIDPVGLAIICDVSLQITFTTTSITTPTLPMTATDVGTVTRAGGGNCSSGATLTLLGLPWTVTLVNGTGGADGTALSINNMQFLLGIGALSCLYGGSLTGTVIASGTQVGGRSSLPHRSGGFLCPSPAVAQLVVYFSPTFRVTLTP